jgi:hypothetical protein
MPNNNRKQAAKEQHKNKKEKKRKKKFDGTKIWTARRWHQFYFFIVIFV